MTFSMRMRAITGAVVLSVLSGAAMATPVSLTYQGSTVQDQRKNVTIQSAPVSYPGTGSWPKTVGAWGFNMQDTSGTLGNFVAWCLDLGSFLSSSSSSSKPYTVTSDPFSNSYGLNAAERGRVQAMFDANFHDVDVTKGIEAAAFQMALWNSIYDADLDVTMGAFSGTAHMDVVSQANAYLASAGSYAGDRKFNLSFLESGSNNTNAGRHQNLVTATPVPLPAAGLLLLMGLAGMGAVARRRQV